MDEQIPTELPDPDPDTSELATGAVPGDGQNLVQIPITEEQISEWFQRVDESQEIRKTLEQKWEILMKEYIPIITEGAEDLKAGIHFRNVHTKIPKLFLTTPDLILTPEGPILDKNIDPLTGVGFDSSDAIPVFGAILKKKLGRKGVHAKRLVAECLFDVLAWAGIGCSKLGYRPATVWTDEPVMGPDPLHVPDPMNPEAVAPQIPQMDPVSGTPITQKVPTVIYEEYYWDRFSPKKLLWDANLKSTRFDKDAAWMGMEFFMPENIARQVYQIPDSIELPKSVNEDDRSYRHGQNKPKTKNLIHGIEIFYKATQYDASEIHPLKLRQLVLFVGDKKQAFVHRNSVDQSFDDQGRITADSVIGFPYQIFTNRDMADAAVPWADNAFTNSAVKHINTHRKQSVKLRDANIGKWLYDSDAFTPEDIALIKKGDIGDWIGLVGGKLAQGQDKIVVPLIKNEASRDDYRTAQILKQDVEETLGIGGVNAGATEDTVRTATEISTSAGALAERLEDERNRVLEDYLCGVEKFAALLQRYASDASVIEWVGKDGQRRFSTWDRHTIAGRWGIEAKPDSQLRVDVARDRAQLMQFAKDTQPAWGVFINPKPLFKKLTTQFGIDPNEIMIPDPLPMMPGQAPGGPAVPGANPPAGPGPNRGPAGPAPSSAPSPTGALPNAPSPGVGTPQIERNKEV